MITLPTNARRRDKARRPLTVSAAANSYYEPNKETLAKLIRGWGGADDCIIANPVGSWRSCRSQTLIADINESFNA